MTNPNKVKGSTFERAVLAALHDCGIIAARRTLNAGIPHDVGDIHIITERDQSIVVQAKNHARLDLAGWSDDAKIQANRLGGDAIPVVVHKRRGSQAGHAYVTLSLTDFCKVIG